MTVSTRRRVAVVLWSILVWCALWSDLSIANVLWGALVGVVTQTLVPLQPRRRPFTVNPVGVVVYVAYALWSLVKSSTVVAWEVVTPVNHINQGIVAVPLQVRSIAIATLIANTVSLTPGTLTLEIREQPLTLYVHIMHLRTIEEVREEIAKLERYAMRAFPEVTRSGVDEEELA